MTDVRETDPRKVTAVPASSSRNCHAIQRRVLATAKSADIFPAVTGSILSRHRLRWSLMALSRALMNLATPKKDAPSFHQGMPLSECDLPS